MDKTPEKLLSDLCSELTAVSLEYASGTVTDIYVYASLEAGFFFDPFFAKGTEVVERHKLPGVDVSIERQDSLLDYGTDQLVQFAKAYSTLGRPVPTEIKLHYVIATGKTDMNLRYEPQWSNNPDLDVSVHSRSEEWLEEVQRKLAS